MENQKYIKNLTHCFSILVDDLDDEEFNGAKNSISKNIEKTENIEVNNILKSIIETAEEERLKKQKLYKMLERQTVPLDEIPTLRDIYNRTHKPGTAIEAMISLYHYGYIQGKRAERKRKNLVSQN
ncbi:hypothetical protein [Vallitalea sp.]|jgi:tRNA U34 5-carboxymethylaminomethyl modifying enzyme MnmG/GidA|uniref:hypothetical protein n=1 Tax=Vallitalea sp. TaxID=1882829 RepID=UPI0025E35A4E|nr:hypothetical protein [Vallitalea sp.]MCT4686375.1 hypothetical protein [Vallitalea sp.]